MAWITGYAYLTGLIAVVITLAWTGASMIYGVANLLNENQINSQGASVGLYIALVVGGTVYCMFGLRFSAYLNKFMVVWVLIGTLVIIIAVPCLAPKHNSAKWVFTEFMNSTGYENSGLTFLIGMVITNIHNLYSSMIFIIIHTNLVKCRLGTCRL